MQFQGVADAGNVWRLSKDKPPLAERLHAYVAANTRRRVYCVSCNLPAELLDAIRAERAAGSTFAPLAAFLRSEGHKIGEDALARHFRDHEQRKG